MIKRWLRMGFALISFSLVAVAGQLTTLQPGISIYSAYYPNPTAKFKGTIIFVNGSGTDLTEWKMNPKFFNCAKQLGSLFLYDRNGLGKSPPDLHLSSHHPISAQHIGDQLSVLLKKRHLKPPYLIVAHSYAAIYAGYFILKNPNLVKAVLLIDPVPSDFHFSDHFMHEHKKGIQDATIQPARYMYKHYSAPETEVFYQLLGFNQSKRSIKQLGPIHHAIPVVILSSTGMEKEHPLKEDWYTGQTQWLNKNANSKIIRVSSDHFIQLKKPQTVCDALEKIL